MYKECYICKKRKPIEDFYKHSQNKDRHLGKCKECCKEIGRINRLKNLEHCREYDRKRAKLEHRRELAEKMNKRMRKTHPEKCRAHLKLKRAVNSGKIVRPGRCSMCGRECKPHGHHKDYSKPLDVVWLCCACHKREHRV